MTESAPRQLPRAQILTIAALQGLALFALYKAFDTGAWPSESPLWSYPLWTLAVAIPVLLLLSLERGNERRVSIAAAGFAAALALLALYTGWQAEPFGAFSVASLSVAFAASISIACFKYLMYLQQWSVRLPMSYEVLFTNSWRNFLVISFAALFVLVFWLILMLWGALFKVIKIDFFADLFARDWFLFPVLSVAHGLGILIFRELTRVIDNITRLLHGLIKLLLPLVVGIAAIFVLALPATGLEPLWSTGRGTLLLLWLTAMILFFANSVYQDGREERPYPQWVHRLVYVGLLVLPILCALSFYGLWLRLDQYGWTVERGWGIVVWLLLTLFSTGYAWGIVTRRGDWPETLARVNTLMGLVVLVLMLLANSPLLDFRKISLNSQLARVDSGEIELAEFDFYYAHQHLARPGFLALEKMKVDVGDSDPELLDRIENPRPTFGARRLGDATQFWAHMQYRPAPFDVPPSVGSQLENMLLPIPGGRDVLFEIDLDRDGQNEYVFVRHDERRLIHAIMFHRVAGRWQQRYVNATGQDYRDVDVAESLTNGKIELTAPRYDDLKVGEILIRPR